jgi:membrane-associated phospholipid phosphatase
MGAPRVFSGIRRGDLLRRFLVLPPFKGRLRGSAIGLDQWALDLFQSVRSPALDALGSIIGLFGQAEVSLGIAVGLALARARRSRRDGLIPLFIIATILIESALKLAIPHAPPPGDRSRTIELLPHLQVPFASSFPSGHVARLTFLATIVRGVPTWLRLLAVVLMIGSRLYLGEHWLSDCLGGLALGWLVAKVATRLERP